MASPETTEGITTGMPSAEAEATMTPTLMELLLPPLSCLAFISIGLTSQFLGFHHGLHRLWTFPNEELDETAEEWPTGWFHMKQYTPLRSTKLYLLLFRDGEGKAARGEEMGTALSKLAQEKMSTVMKLGTTALYLAKLWAGLVLWAVFQRVRSRKTIIYTACTNDESLSTPQCPRQKEQTRHEKHPTRVHPIQDGKNNQLVFALNASQLQGNKNNNKSNDTSADNTTQLLSLQPLFQPNDLQLINQLQGQEQTNARELFYILLPIILSLGFCPLTLLLHGPLVKWLWPPHIFPTAPNINDAIACFLVPAGMVYAISFGFAFQQVAGGFKETEMGVQKQAAELAKLLALTSRLTVVTTTSRIAMVRVVKRVVLTSLSRFLGAGSSGRAKKNSVDEDLEDLLRLLYASKFKNADSVKDIEPWQRSVYKRLERMLSQDDILSFEVCRTRIHALQWAFLESLGYFTFVGVLLVQCSSYRAELAMCLITVISISLLCYVVADLDSPFHGFFRVDLDCFCRLVTQLDHVFNKDVADIMLEKSFVDFDVKTGN